MKKLILALAVALGLAFPAAAQTYKGTCTSSSTSSGLSFSISGGSVDEVTFRLLGTWTATVSWYTSSDGGYNWDAAYPQTGSTGTYATASTATANGTYLMTVPGNATHVKANCTAYTSGTVHITGVVSKTHAAGSKAGATLYDSTSAVNIHSGAINVAGWDKVLVSASGGVATSTLAAYAVLDTGASSTVALVGEQVGTRFNYVFGDSVGVHTVSSTASAPLPKRLNVIFKTGTAAANLHIEGQRK